MKYSLKRDSSSYKYFFIKGLLISFVMTVLLLIIFTLVLTFTNISENMLTVFNSISIITSIAIGSVYISYKANRKGWIVGGIIGFCYIIIIILVGAMINKELGFDLYIITKILIALIVGIIGGMIGVNLK